MSHLLESADFPKDERSNLTINLFHPRRSHPEVWGLTVNIPDLFLYELLQRLKTLLASESSII